MSYRKLLLCAGMTHEEVVECRMFGKSSKVVSQSAFFKFISELSHLANNRE